MRSAHSTIALRIQIFLVLVTAALAVCYLAFYRPLVRQSDALDVPLTNLWTQLGSSPVRLAERGPEMFQIHQVRAQTEDYLKVLQDAARAVSARLALDSEIRRRMREPFQLIDYFNERQNRLEDLERLAKQQQVNLDPTVLESLPEYNAEIREPELLWGQLEAAQQLISSAVQCKVEVVRKLQVSAVQTYASPELGGAYLHEFPVRMEVVGSMSAISQLLGSLPRRAEELQLQGLPVTSTNKMPLFVRGLVLKKNAPLQPEQVSLDLRAAALVYVN